MIDVKKALIDPSSVFHNPEEILATEGLSKELKIRILHRWEYDAREMQVAEEENMQGNAQTDNSDLFARILRALISLGADPCLDHTAPTKQGGEDGEIKE